MIANNPMNNPAPANGANMAAIIGGGNPIIATLVIEPNGTFVLHGIGNLDEVYVIPSALAGGADIPLQNLGGIGNNNLEVAGNNASGGDEGQ